MSDVRQIWENAMINLVIDFPIYAELITKIGCKFVKAGKDSAVAWTDGRAITINEEMVEEFNQNPIITDDTGKEVNRTITQKEMQFIVCHELLHLLGLTFDRMKNVGVYKEDLDTDEGRRRWELWNKATDYEINSLLHNNESTDATYGDRKRNPVGNMPEWVLYESEYKDLQAEEIFKRLVEEEKQNNNGTLMKPQSGTGNASGNGKNGMIPLDDHLPIEDEDVKNEVISKMSEVYGSRQNGLGESALDRIINRAYKPVPFNWRKALSKYIRGYIKANYTWNKPSRAGIANNIIMPSAGTTPKLHIGVAIDTSGSISDKEINTMMDHVFTILQQFKSFEIDIWCCGSKVYEETLLKLTGANKNKLGEFKVVSDGGNDMRENFKFIKEHYKGKDKIDMLMILSDFYDPLDGDTETTSICPCVFMCIDHKDFKKPTKIKGEVYPFEVDADK